MTRRKLPRKYKDGGAVPIPDTAPGLPGFGLEEPEAPTADATSDVQNGSALPATPPASNEGADAIMHALAAQRRAEQMQRDAIERQPAPEHQQPAPSESDPPTLEQQIDAQPWSDRRKAFIKAHPELLLPQNGGAIEVYFKQERLRGIDPDSAEMDDHILAGVRWEQHQRAPRREPEPPRDPEPAQARQEPVPELRPRSMPEPRRSMPMSAPVSREAPSANGRPRDADNTLSPAEREIAWTLPAPGMSKREKELLYLRNRQKYEAMKADGSYADQRQR
jgi:hypothetical protein